MFLVGCPNVESDAPIEETVCDQTKLLLLFVANLDIDIDSFDVLELQEQERKNSHGTNLSNFIVEKSNMNQKKLVKTFSDAQT